MRSEASEVGAACRTRGERVCEAERSKGRCANERKRGNRWTPLPAGVWGTDGRSRRRGRGGGGETEGRRARRARPAPSSADLCACIGARGTTARRGRGGVVERPFPLQRIRNFPLRGRGTPGLRQGHNAPCPPEAHRSVLCPVRRRSPRRAPCPRRRPRRGTC